MYYAEDRREKARIQVNMEVKYRIEMDSLKEGIRDIMKNKVINEWIDARNMLYRQMKKEDKQPSIEMINTQVIDHEVDSCIMEAFNETVTLLKEEVGLAMNNADLNLLKAR